MNKSNKYEIRVLRDAFGQVLRIGSEKLQHESKDCCPPAVLLISFYFSNDRAPSYFLLPADGALYPILLDLMPVSHPRPGAVALESAASGRYVSSTPIKNNKFVIKPSAFRKNDWEAFFLAEDYPLDPKVSEIAETCIDMLNSSSLGAIILSAVRYKQTESLAAIQHCHHLIPWHALNTLVCANGDWLNKKFFKTFISETQNCQMDGIKNVYNLIRKPRFGRIKNFFRNIPIFKRLLSRSLLEPITLDSHSSSLENESWGEGSSSFWQSVNLGLRQKVTPSRGLCILAAMRNEGSYVLEWIAYHRLLGVEHFFIYTNDNEDRSDALLASLHRAGLITLFYNTVADGGSAQNKAYAHALSVDTGILDYKWCAIIDIDEFLRPKDLRRGGMIDYLAGKEFDHADAIAINWRIMSPIERRPASSAHLVTANQTCYSESINAHVKCIIRPRKFIRSSPHIARSDRRCRFKVVASDGNKFVSLVDQNVDLDKMYIALSANPLIEPCYIAHHVFMSAEEFAIKRARNGGDRPLTKNNVINIVEPSQAKHFLETFYSNQQCAPIPQKFADDLLEITIALEDIPEVYMALSDCRSWQNMKLSTVREHYKAELDHINNEFAKKFAQLIIGG